MLREMYLRILSNSLTGEKNEIHRCEFFMELLAPNLIQSMLSNHHVSARVVIRILAKLNYSTNQCEINLWIYKVGIATNKLLESQEASDALIADCLYLFSYLLSEFRKNIYK